MCVNPSNPLLHSLINSLRDMNLSPLVFRLKIKEIAKLLLYEAMYDISLSTKNVQTWQGKRDVECIDEQEIMIVSVLRAALPMHEALIETLPYAVSGFLGMKRDETTHQSVLYYDRVGDCSGKTVIIVDPMVATGGSLNDAIGVIKQKGAKRIKTLHVIASPEGINAVEESHADVEIYIAQIDEKLSPDKFIIPGLGDAGDRAYNTL